MYGSQKEDLFIIKYIIKLDPLTHYFLKINNKYLRFEKSVRFGERPNARRFQCVAPCVISAQEYVCYAIFALFKAVMLVRDLARSILECQLASIVKQE